LFSNNKKKNQFFVFSRFKKKYKYKFSFKYVDYSSIRTSPARYFRNFLTNEFRRRWSVVSMTTAVLVRRSNGTLDAKLLDAGTPPPCYAEVLASGISNSALGQDLLHNNLLQVIHFYNFELYLKFDKY
jgi:hypothetical protein